ncbi:MAG TPA: VTT domain-containing protein, partial [Tepidisphaeraceae bacterium]|nr:VTT domain-containing protein [Tepidisphaeraceae bacterium]
FLIIFAETGLVVTPFLPGDSLLFAIGAIGARHEIQLDLPLLTILLMIAAIAGDAVNYWIGYRLGPAVFTHDTEEDWKELPAGEKVEYARPVRKKKLSDKLLNRKHLLRAQEFYEKYGGKTIILARFVPVVRTFAPFVAGVGKMNFFRFWLFNIVGAIAWVLICVLAGKFFGGFAFVQKHFELVIIAIIFISILPMIVEFLRARQAAKRGGSSVLEATTIGKSED